MACWSCNVIRHWFPSARCSTIAAQPTTASELQCSIPLDTSDNKPSALASLTGRPCLRPSYVPKGAARTLCGILRCKIPPGKEDFQGNENLHMPDNLEPYDAHARAMLESARPTQRHPHRSVQSIRGVDALYAYMVWRLWEWATSSDHPKLGDWHLCQSPDPSPFPQSSILMARQSLAMIEMPNVIAQLVCDMRTHMLQEPPVGFEPTTSRLLSGCSAS